MRIIRFAVLFLFGLTFLWIFAVLSQQAYSKAEFFFGAAKGTATIERWSVKSRSDAHGGGFNFPSSTKSVVFSELALLVEAETGVKFQCEAFGPQARVNGVTPALILEAESATRALSEKPIDVWYRASEGTIKCELKNWFPYAKTFFSLFFLVAAALLFVESVRGLRGDKKNSSTAT